VLVTRGIPGGKGPRPSSDASASGHRLSCRALAEPVDRVLQLRQDRLVIDAALAGACDNRHDVVGQPLTRPHPLPGSQGVACAASSIRRSGSRYSSLPHDISMPASLSGAIRVVHCSVGLPGRARIAAICGLWP
jgi:hypothetical protein